MIHYDWQSARDAVRADHRPGGWRGPVGAALADSGHELAERGERSQRVVIVFEHRDVNEADPVVEPDGNGAEPVGQLPGELGEHSLDQPLVLVSRVGTRGVADDRSMAHDT